MAHKRGLLSQVSYICAHPATFLYGASMFRMRLSPLIPMYLSKLKPQSLPPLLLFHYPGILHKCLHFPVSHSCSLPLLLLQCVPPLSPAQPHFSWGHCGFYRLSSNQLFRSIVRSYSHPYVRPSFGAVGDCFISLVNIASIFLHSSIVSTL